MPGTNHETTNSQQSRRNFLAIAGTSLAASSLLKSQVFGAKTGESNWTQWRGSQRDGIVSADWPNSINESTLVKKWSVPFSESYSGPIVDAQNVYTTETVDEKIERVTAIDRVSGDTAWTTEWEGSMKVPFFAARNGSWIRSTPALGSNKLVVGGIEDHLVCLDTNDGTKAWEQDFPATMNSGKPMFGCACSPLIDGDAVYMQAADKVLKLDLNSGKVLWQALPNASSGESAFSSPTIATFHGRRQLVVQTRAALAGLDLETGQTIWQKQIEAFRGMNILTPTVIGNRIFTSSYGGKAWMYEFDPTDANDQQWNVREAWNNKLQAYMSTPVVVDGHLFLHLRNQRFCCVEAATGEIKWTTIPKGEYWSLITNGDLILALEADGTLRLIRPNTEKYDVIEERKVSDNETWAHLAFDDSQVFIRDLKSLSAWAWG